MNQIPQRTAGAVTRDTLRAINRPPIPPYTAANIRSANFSSPYSAAPNQAANPAHAYQAHPAAAAPVQHPTPVSQPVMSAPVQHPSPSPAPAPAPAPAPQDMVLPQLTDPLRKGQKVALDPQGGNILHITAGFGWNVRDSRCDVNASAFLLAANGKVPGDEWFVFYGQDTSPDGSTIFGEDPAHKDRNIIRIDLTKLDPHITKIVFVLTIHEAYAQNLNFSMLKDPYVRLMDSDTGRVLRCYRMDELYANVTSMTIGELYLHNGQWKFNPVGNGVNQDLAGQCAIYGVQIE